MSKQPEPKVRLEDTTAITCEKCSGEVFVEGMLLRKVSKILSATPQDAVIPIPTFACSNCGHVNAGFKPAGLPKHDVI